PPSSAVSARTTAAGRWSTARFYAWRASSQASSPPRRRSWVSGSRSSRVLRGATFRPLSLRRRHARIERDPNPNPKVSPPPEGLANRDPDGGAGRATLAVGDVDRQPVGAVTAQTDGDAARSAREQATVEPPAVGQRVAVAVRGAGRERDTRAVASPPLAGEPHHRRRVGKEEGRRVDGRRLAT